MKIHFERTGGFAGIKRIGTIDSANLSQSQTQKLNQLISKSHLLDRPLSLNPPHAGPDRFNYKLIIETESGMRTVEASELSLSPEVRPLLDLLTRLSK